MWIFSPTGRKAYLEYLRNLPPQAVLLACFLLLELPRKCSGLMKPDTHLGENARQTEVSDDQTTPFLFC